MRLVFAAALALALAACGGGGGEDDELATDRSEISAAQLDAALGPEDQSTIRDAGAEDVLENAFGSDEPAQNAPANAVTPETE